jgi:hypothetical protein
MPKQIKTFGDHFGEDNKDQIKRTLEKLFESQGGCVIIIMPPRDYTSKPRIIDAYYNIHANCVRGIVNASLKDAVRNNLLMEGRPVAFYVGNGKNNHHSCRQGATLTNNSRVV